MAVPDFGTVLVVDDNAENRALARDILDSEGIRTVVTSSGPASLEAFAREWVDCILLDIRMPVMDGIEVCERIRASPGGDRVAIIFVTAQRDVETFDRALAAGGDDFITKPFRPAELIVRIQTALRMRHIAAERGVLATELKQQRDALQRLQLEKEQLAAFLVHDLKNPVASIELQAQRVIRNPGDANRARDAAKSISAETKSLMRMITNLLDIEKADAGQLEPVRRAVDARVLIGTVLEELSVRASAAEVELVAEVDAPVMNVDSDLMYRTLANLVDNAIRHAPSGSKVIVRATHRDQAFELRVIDTGPGVPEDMRSSVFERFVTSRPNGDRPNRGLGLAFCKLVVRAHGGEIWIEDGNPGAVFCVRLPDQPQVSS